MILKTVLQENHLRDSIILSISDGVTDIVSNSAGTAHTIFLDRDHNYNSVAIATVTPGSAGSGYGNGTGAEEFLYNAILGPNTMRVKVQLLESRLTQLVN